ncbi:hypothetical protein, partial [Nocardia cyriacigeorgica]|uniref:hypothetical protein n=1 Tax=Nocardia cyriacigeorgica TaxID=135487 RepID=UPI001E4F6FB5
PGLPGPVRGAAAGVPGGRGRLPGRRRLGLVAHQGADTERDAEQQQQRTAHRGELAAIRHQLAIA